jgi:uncharacterized protein YjbJ (UPF0337 family)
MNTDQIKGNWKQLVGKARETWGRLTDDDWKVVEGKRDQLVGKIQERYGIARGGTSGIRVREKPWRSSILVPGLSPSRNRNSGASSAT